MCVNVVFSSGRAGARLVFCCEVCGGHHFKARTAAAASRLQPGAYREGHGTWAFSAAKLLHSTQNDKQINRFSGENGYFVKFNEQKRASLDAFARGLGRK